MMRILCLMMMQLFFNVSVFSEELHSSVRTKTEKKTNEIHFNFTAEPTGGMKLNYEGPWALSLSDVDGIELPKNSFKLSDFTQEPKEASVNFNTKKLKEQGKLNYRLTAFSCTEDKTKCFRDVHKGNLNW